MQITILGCIKSIAGLNRGFNPEVSDRLDRAGYKLATDPEAFYSPVDNPRMHNPNYEVPDPGSRETNPEEVNDFVNKSRGLTPAENGIGMIVTMPSFLSSKFPGLGLKIAKAAKEGAKKSPKKDDKKEKKSAKNESVLDAATKSKARAVNALARVSQNGTPEEKAQVKSAVHSKYPDVGEKFEHSLSEGRKSNLTRLASKLVNRR
jgi:hypothetical protein